MLEQLSHRIFSDKFNYIIGPLVVGVATSGLIFQNIIFFPNLQRQNEILFRTIAFILYIMCFISFYKAITIKNSPPMNLLKPRLKKMLKNHPSFYTQVNQCQKQNGKYKPARTSHCSVCKCVVRMDHHCPYINNCVGWKNLKSFILFTGYGGLFALQFLIFSTKHYFDLKYQRIQPMSQGLVTIWLILTAISFLLTLSMCGLAISNIVMASKNITQLQMMKGHFRFNDVTGLNPNPYDLGIFTNLNYTFQSDKWLFWWPTQIITQNDGTEYPMIPQITQSAIKQLPEHIKQDIKTPTQKLIPKTIQQLKQKQKQNYKDTIFFFLGEQYTLNDDQQNNQNTNKFNPIIVKNTNGVSSYQIQQLQYQKRLQQQAQNLKQVQNVILGSKQQHIDTQQDDKKILQEIYGDINQNSQPNSNQYSQNNQEYKQIQDDDDINQKYNQDEVD